MAASSSGTEVKTPRRMRSSGAMALVVVRHGARSAPFSSAALVGYGRRHASLVAREEGVSFAKVWRLADRQCIELTAGQKAKGYWRQSPAWRVAVRARHLLAVNLGAACAASLLKLSVERLPVGADRRELLKLLQSLAAGDTVTVTRIDRLARSTFELFGIVRRSLDAKAQFRSLAERWANTGTSNGRLMLAVLGGLADAECDLIRTRTAEGRSRAKAQGHQMGGPPHSGPAERRYPTPRGGRYARRAPPQLERRHTHHSPRDESRMSSAAATIPALDPADGCPTDAGGACDFLLCPVRVHVPGLDHGRGHSRDGGFAGQFRSYLAAHVAPDPKSKEPLTCGWTKDAHMADGPLDARPSGQCSNTAAEARSRCRLANRLPVILKIMRRRLERERLVY